MELHERQPGKFEVEVYYRNDSAAQEPSLLPVLFSNCKSPCPLDDFAKFAASHIPTDWAAECRLNNPPEMVYKGVAIGLGVLAFVLAILLAFSLYVNFRTRFGIDFFIYLRVAFDFDRNALDVTQMKFQMISGQYKNY